MIGTFALCLAFGWLVARLLPYPLRAIGHLLCWLGDQVDQPAQ